MTKPRTKRTPYPWTHPAFPYRVFFYPGRGGTRCQYFTTRTEAESFAMGRICWGEPARVDEKQGVVMSARLKTFNAAANPTETQTSDERIKALCEALTALVPCDYVFNKPRWVREAYIQLAALTEGLRALDRAKP